MNGFSFAWKDKSEMPAETIEGGPLVKSAARTLYLVSEFTNTQHEIRVIARKK